MQAHKRAILTPEAIRQIRQAKRLSLKEFWGAIGYTSTRGHFYETGKTQMPEHALRLVYMEYVAGIPTDIKSERFQKFENALRANNPASLTDIRQALESSIGVMQDTLTRLAP